jgi:hypothetical protein
VGPLPLLSAGQAERNSSGMVVAHPGEAETATQGAAAEVIQQEGAGPGAHINSDTSGGAVPKTTQVQPSANGRQPPAGQTLAKRAPAGAVTAPGQPGAKALQARLESPFSISLPQTPALTCVYPLSRLQLGPCLTGGTACAQVFQLPWINLFPSLTACLDGRKPS